MLATIHIFRMVWVLKTFLNKYLEASKQHIKKTYAFFSTTLHELFEKNCIFRKEVGACNLSERNAVQNFDVILHLT